MKKTILSTIAIAVLAIISYELADASGGAGGAAPSVVNGVVAGSGSNTAICDTPGNVEIGTVTSANDETILPATPVFGHRCSIVNRGANTVDIHPGSGDVLCLAGGACSAPNAVLTITATNALDCWASTTSKWYCR